jgi:hypothetical protein
LKFKNHDVIFTIDVVKQLYTSASAFPPMMGPVDAELMSGEQPLIFTREDKEVFIEFVNELYLFIKQESDIKEDGETKE